MAPQHLQSRKRFEHGRNLSLFALVISGLDEPAHCDRLANGSLLTRICLAQFHLELILPMAQTEHCTYLDCQSSGMMGQ
jgi:hypothetical protein